MFGISFLGTERKMERAGRNSQCSLIDAAYVISAYSGQSHHAVRVKVKGIDMNKPQNGEEFSISEQ